ncbi:uncharacterized protein Z518_00291 [Rhinocladiella mackenziei CBS 650.93]|uniref:Rhinocladiella mackenziei CBS 650.93 unplaced genomic scaffold supercont1.1, whole genome shotgun sequence n=1 Tax=Rhinocladiella mackenziei CBS 650.93 TaxID=1442369 RepID=A0A0D2G3N2_9EURO|nr:uncharacterized protein Z518_00291 [Rhinocladiella mackenziei CBS 650.93]KIX09212.1 hypothetical protein Z518_00291 [Rhinocladiella mackenziei CBS 650.93]
MSLFSGVALVIGAGSGDGRAVMHLLVQSGCSKVVLADLNETNLARVEAECRNLGGSQLQILSQKCDTRVPSDLDRIIASAVNRFGEINYCANCERPTGPLEGNTTEISLAEFTNAADVWQRGTWLAMRSEVRQFLVQKRKDNKSVATIVNISASQGLASESGFPGYCAAGHGIVGMTRATAMDYLPNGIRINCVCAGPSTGEPAGEPRDLGRVQRRSLPRAPLTRDITPEEVAQAVVFLLGEGASGITGIELPVDGGWSLYHH